jgi:O-antigen/teichoic acid export membrane protein
MGTLDATNTTEADGDRSAKTPRPVFIRRANHLRINTGNNGRRRGVSQKWIWAERLLVVSISPIIGFGSRFARNVILSRGLVPEEFGTAIAISVVISLVWLVTDVALDRFVIINKSPQSLAAAHLLSIIRGILISLVLVLFGHIMAVVFGVPQFSKSFMAAGLVPLIYGFGHFWIKQAQRDYIYVPEALAQLTANLAAIAVLSLAVAVFEDHRAVLFGFAAETAVYVVASHVIARVPYEIRPDRATLRAAISFGLPLTLNGIGLATITQLDRMLVGSRFGVGTLGLYAVILNISVMPTSLILNSASTLAMSYLVSEEHATGVRPEKYRALVALFSMIGVIYALFVAVTLDWLTPYIFGPVFKIDENVHLLIVMIVYFRIQRAGAPTSLLLVTRQTGRLAFLNLSAGLGLVVALVLVTLRPRFEAMLFGVLIGDIISYILSLFISSRQAFGRGGVGLVDSGVGMAALLAISGALAWEPSLTWKARGVVLIVGLLAIVIQGGFELYKNEKLRTLIRSAL